MDGRFLGTFNPGDDNGDVVHNYLNLPDSDWSSPPPAPQVPPLTPLPQSPVVDDFDMAILDSIDTNLFWEIDAGAALTLPALGAPEPQAVDEGPPPKEERGKAEQMALVPFWLPVQDLDCSGCLVLRELIHSDGGKTTKLSLHGGPGFFYHAVLHVYHDGGGGYSLLMQPSSYLDLSTQSLEWVKQFLINYDIERLRESCVMLQDSLSAFCDALCVRLSDAGSAGDLSRPPCTADVQQAALRTPPPKPPHELGTGGSATRRSDLDIATQRERTRRLDLKEVANYVHLPITEAAKELRICPTALKKVCRRHGLPRWPFRKVRSLEREILNLQKELRPGTAAEAENIRAKIDRLVDEKARICRRDCS